MEASHLYLLPLVQAERDIFKDAEARVTAGQQPRCRCGGGGDLSCDADNGDDVMMTADHTIDHCPHQVRGGWRCHHFTPRQDLYQIINKHTTSSYL